jgi:FkbM family methyltransferase
MPVAQNLNHCDTKYGRFSFPKADMYIGRSLEVYGQYCESEVDLFQQILRKGDIVVDAGANIGAFTVPISKMIGSEGMVYAFEPQPFLCSLLSLNLLANDCFNARALSIALGERAGKITVPNFNYGARNNFGGISFAAPHPKIEAGTGALGIAKMRLDDVIDVPALRLIKADVEGMELAFLKGAKKILKTHKPYLYLECDKVDAADALIGFLESLGYRCFWHISALFDEGNWKGCAENVFGNATCVNLLCVPDDTKVEKFNPATDSTSHPRYIKSAAT